MHRDPVNALLIFPNDYILQNYRCISRKLTLNTSDTVGGPPVDLLKQPPTSFYSILVFGSVCGILVPQPGIKPVCPALEVWDLNHCTTVGSPLVHPLNPWQALIRLLFLQLCHFKKAR